MLTVCSVYMSKHDVSLVKQKTSMVSTFYVASDVFVATFQIRHPITGAVSGANVKYRLSP